MDRGHHRFREPRHTSTPKRQRRRWAGGASGLTTDEAECVSSAEKTAAESLEPLMMLSAISLGRGGAASRVLACPKLKFEWESMRAVRLHEPLNCSCRNMRSTAAGSGVSDVVLVVLVVERGAGGAGHLSPRC